MSYWQRMGQHFGYPPCCVSHFAALIGEGRMPGREAVALDPCGPWEGTGFVPCPAHLEELRGKTIDDVAKLISKRTHPLPFPHTDDIVLDGIALAASQPETTRELQNAT